MGALIIRIRLLLKDSLKGLYTGSIVGFYTMGALIIRIRLLLKGSFKRVLHMSYYKGLIMR